MKKLSLIPFVLLCLILSSCNFNKERDKQIIETLDINTALLWDNVFQRFSYIHQEIKEKGGRKSEVSVYESLDSLIVNTKSLFKVIDSNQPASVEEINMLKLAYNHLNHRFHNIYHGSDTPFLNDSVIVQIPTSEIEKSLFKNKTMQVLNEITHQGSGLVGTCNWYMGPDYKAQFSVLKNNLNELILYPGLHIPENGEVKISNIRFNDSPIKTEMKKIGYCFYLKFEADIKEKNEVTYNMQYIYRGDTISFKEATIQVLL